MNRLLRVLPSRLALLLAFLAMITVAGCRSQKESAAGSAAASTAISDFASMVGSYTPWQKIRVPFTLKLLSPQKFSIGGTAVFDRGTMVNMSMRMFGLEVAVVQITPDSLTLVEKMNKQYLSVPVASALGGLDASVDNIQDLLTGRAFILGADSLTVGMKDLFTIRRTQPGQPWMLTPRHQPAAASYSFAIAPSGALAILSVETSGGQQANATYISADTADPHGALASSLLVTTRLNNKDLQIMIEWDFSRARWDDDVETKPLTLGRNYRPLDINALIKSLPSTIN